MEGILNAIATKLRHEGLNKKNYTHMKAIAILVHTSMPNRLVAILKAYEHQIIEKL